MLFPQTMHPLFSLGRCLTMRYCYLSMIGRMFSVYDMFSNFQSSYNWVHSSYMQLKIYSYMFIFTYHLMLQILCCSCSSLIPKKFERKCEEKIQKINKNWCKVNKLFLYHISDSFNLFNSSTKNNNNNNLNT